MKYKNILLKIATWLSYAILSVAAYIVIVLLLRVFITDWFPVNSTSMYPTVQPGDKILANKLVFGARIYKNLKFTEGEPLEYFRVKGLRKIRHNDLAVFNYPTDGDHIKFVMNSVYLKRCLGLPGDTLSIVDGIYRNSSAPDSVGVYSIQKSVAHIVDSSVLYCYPFHDECKWTIKNFGPLYLPRQGDTIRMDKHHYILYARYIEYETGIAPRLSGDSVLINGTYAPHYVFKENYYFMGGDNILNSRDSRYFGLIPEPFLIGVVQHIWYARDKNTDKFRWERFLKRLR